MNNMYEIPITVEFIEKLTWGQLKKLSLQSVGI
jgi:hypothetical protein